MKLLLIRHGLTDANAQNIIQGHQPTPLNAMGFRQAKLLAQRLAQTGPAFDALICSDLLRARQTADAIAQVCGQAVVADTAWRERCFGPWEGQQRSVADIWKAASGGFTPPGAEEPQAFRSRVREALLAVARCYADGQTIAVVTHGGPCRVILSMLAEGELASAPGSRPPGMEMIANCSIMHLECSAAARDIHWTLTRLNDIDHLASEAAATVADAG
jgi:2,3-bisphosphoglycerate-dependent phosphoglycerate mutase